MHDDLMDRLADARPATTTELPDTQLLERILGTNRRVVTPFRLSAAAAVAAAIVAVLMLLPSTTTTQHTTPPRLDMQRIAESTSAALSSGRAHVHFSAKTDRQAKPRLETSDFVVEFAGDDRAMAGTVDPGDDRGAGAFSIANKVVDGRFFLDDGTRWVEDTTANLSGTDVFSVDPRNFLTGVADAARFEERGRETIDGVSTRHLVATRVADIPPFNLGLGPTDAKSDGLEKFEVWVDDHDVVRALLVAAERKEDTYPLAQTRFTRDANGTVHKSLDPATMGDPVVVTTVSTYKVEFTDLGTDIRIQAPANAVTIEGKG